VPVTEFDPATGVAKELAGPKYTDAEAAKAFWAPVAAGIKDILKKRGLEQAGMLGVGTDMVPSKCVVDLWKELWPEAPWVVQAHQYVKRVHGVPVGYNTNVKMAGVKQGKGFQYDYVDPAIRREYGWRSELPMAHFPREILNIVGQDTARNLVEASSLSLHRGCGRLAGDFFNVQNERGQWFNLPRRYIYHGALGLSGEWLGAGAKGPVSTVRFEMLRDGLQEHEARIVLERALLDGSLGKGLGEKRAAEVQAMLDERTRYISWGEGRFTVDWGPYSFLPGGPLGSRWYGYSGWQERSERLFAAAAEAQKLMNEAQILRTK
jgi:hypothetical protein